MDEYDADRRQTVMNGMMDGCTKKGWLMKTSISLNSAHEWIRTTRVFGGYKWLRRYCVVDTSLGAHLSMHEDDTMGDDALTTFNLLDDNVTITLVDPSDARFVDAKDVAKYLHQCFEVKTAHKSYFFSCASRGELDEWLDALASARDDAMRRNELISGRRTTRTLVSSPELALAGSTSSADRLTAGSGGGGRGEGAGGRTPVDKFRGTLGRPASAMNVLCTGSSRTTDDLGEMGRSGASRLRSGSSSASIIEALSLSVPDGGGAGRRGGVGGRFDRFDRFDKFDRTGRAVPDTGTPPRRSRRTTVSIMRSGVGS